MTTEFSPEIVALVLALGLVLSLGCYLVSNLSPGGMITPGWLAFALIESPRLGVLLVAVVVVTYSSARGVMCVAILYGKRLFAAVLLLGLFFSTTAFIVFSASIPSLTATGTLGFVAPGLVAYQLIRQQLVPTLVATSAVTSLTYAIVLAGVVFDAVPTGTTDTTALGEVHLPSLTADHLRIAALALLATFGLGLLARLHRVRSLSLGPVLSAFAFAGAAGRDAVALEPPERAAALDAAALARQASSLAGRDWECFLLHLRDHAERTERLGFDSLVGISHREHTPCGCP